MVWPPGTPSLKAKATRRRKQPMAKTDTILVVNAGSSSIKFSLYPAAPGDSAILGGGIVEGIGVAPQFKGRICGRISEERWPDGRALDHDHFFGFLLDWLAEAAPELAVVAAGHRVVQGELGRASGRERVCTDG